MVMLDPVPPKNNAHVVHQLKLRNHILLHNQLLLDVEDGKIKTLLWFIRLLEMYVRAIASNHSSEL